MKEGDGKLGNVQSQSVHGHKMAAAHPYSTNFARIFVGIYSQPDARSPRHSFCFYSVIIQ